MCRKNFPKQLRPFKQDVSNVESLQDSDPVGVAEMEIFHNAGGFRIPNIASTEIEMDIKKAYDRKHLLVELYTPIRSDHDC
jgi:hypothetical protein